MSKSSAKLMTEGSIWKRIVAFAIPLFWGNLFQQLYNTGSDGDYIKKTDQKKDQITGRADSGKRRASRKFPTIRESAVLYSC